MRNQWKKLLTSMLIVCLLFSSIVAAGVKDVKAEQMIGENTDSDMSEEYDVKLTYDVTGTWDGHSNVEVKLTNILDEKIEDWDKPGQIPPLLHPVFFQTISFPPQPRWPLFENSLPVP